MPAPPTPVIGTVSVGGASTLVRAENYRRGQIAIRNGSGAATLWLAFGQAAEVGKGIAVPPLATYFEECSKVYIDGDRWRCLAVYGISDGAAIDASYQDSHQE
jgi:hypothetical protein